MKRINKGFTLIEVMIVMMIIGVLSSVAIPMYSDYTRSVKISTYIYELGSVKTRIGICYQKSFTLSGCNPSPPPITPIKSEYIDYATIVDGIIDVEFLIPDDLGANYHITLTPIVDSGQIMYFKESGNVCNLDDIVCPRFND